MQTILIKFGGSLFTDENSREQFWLDIKNLIQRNFKIVIVHGGGKEISKWIEKAGSEVKFVNGLRYTSKEIMTIVEMVLSGSVNKQLTSELSKLNVKCVGISGRDNNLVIAKNFKKDLGLVGEPINVNIELLQNMLNLNIVPIISPVSSDENFDAINVNADSCANAIAIALKVDFLVFMTDTKGVLKDVNNENSVIKILDKCRADEYVKSGIIKGGMLPKIESAFSAIDQGVGAVDIVDGRVCGVIGEMFLNRKSMGTKII